MYNLLVGKRKVESMLMFPFILLGRLIAFFEKAEAYEIYFFFPFYHVGGAEKIHYQIAQTFTGKNAIIYFTRKSKGLNFLDEFRTAGFQIRDISRFTDNKFLYPINFIYRGIISQRINRQNQVPIVFNGQSNFGYKVSPWISKKVPQADLIHALCSFSKIRIPFLEFYRKSITVSNEVLQKHDLLYTKYKIPEKIKKNITYINYGMDLPLRKPKENFTGHLKVLYVGRGSEEKRVHLVARIAKLSTEKQLPFRFRFLGEVKEFIPRELHDYCTFYGSVTDINKVDQIFRENNVLIVTSYTESGPLVVMEAMARGLIIISTPVGIVNEHVKSGKNGWVFSSIDDVNLIMQEAMDYLVALSQDLRAQKAMAEENMEYAFRNFGIQHFRESYRRFFQLLKSTL